VAKSLSRLNRGRDVAASLIRFFKSMDDIKSKVVLPLFDTPTSTANANGPAVSLAGFQGMVDVIATVGTPGNGTGTISFQLQTSADGKCRAGSGSVYDGQRTRGSEP
jgi:hypothetical protein